MADITVDVSITSTTPLTATYKSSNSPDVSTTGDIEVSAGERAGITFDPAPESPIQGWYFVAPYVTIVPLASAPPGPFPGSPQSWVAVLVDDADSNTSKETYEYQYTLYTNLGQLDPRIINKPGG